MSVLKIEKLDPYSTAKSFRHELYEHVLLAWETDRVQTDSDRFSKKMVWDKLNLELVSKRKIADVEEEFNKRGQKNKNTCEILVFYCKGKTYESLFKSLRDVVAHGHYGSLKQGWISIRHVYQGPRDKKPTVRIFGTCKTTTLKKLITFLDLASALDKENR